MADQGDPIQPDHRLLVKAVEGYETPGCHVNIWLPHGPQPGSSIPLMV